MCYIGPVCHMPTRVPTRLRILLWRYLLILACPAGDRLTRVLLFLLVLVFCNFNAKLSLHGLSVVLLCKKGTTSVSSPGQSMSDAGWYCIQLRQTSDR